MTPLDDVTASDATMDSPGVTERAEASRSEVAAALVGAATYGPYFALDTAPDDRYVPVDAATLTTRVERTWEELGRRSEEPVERRVAASLAHLDLVARWVSPALVAAASQAVVPDLTRLVWRPDRPSPVPVGLRPPAGWRSTDLGPALRVVEELGELVAPRLNVHIRRGNVASAVASAGRLAPVCAELAAAVLARMPDAGGAQPRGFRRTSCCLYYRVHARAGLCGDCPLADR